MSVILKFLVIPVDESHNAKHWCMMADSKLSMAVIQKTCWVDVDKICKARPARITKIFRIWVIRHHTPATF